jgi:hypothetical protein
VAVMVAVTVAAAATKSGKLIPLVNKGVDQCG